MTIIITIYHFSKMIKTCFIFSRIEKDAAFSRYSDFLSS